MTPEQIRNEVHAVLGSFKLSSASDTVEYQVQVLQTRMLGEIAARLAEIVGNRPVARPVMWR